MEVVFLEEICREQFTGLDRPILTGGTWFSLGSRREEEDTTQGGSPDEDLCRE